MKINKIAVLSLRNAQNWSQEDLAAAAGVSVRTIQRMESQGVSSLETVKGVAAAFNIDFTEIFIPEFEFADYFYLLKPFWKYLLIGIGITVIGFIFLLLLEVFSEATAAYIAGATLATLLWCCITEMNALYEKKFGPIEYTKSFWLGRPTKRD